MARYRSGLRTRDRILDATRSVLGMVGIEGATISAILEKAGVRSGSFYNLFESKDEAILTVVGEAISAVDPHPDGEGPDTIEELVDAYVDFVTGEPALARIYLQIAVSGTIRDESLSNRILRHHRQRVKRFAAALPVTGKNSREARAELLLAVLNGLALQSILDPDLAFRKRAKEAMKLLL